MIENLWKTPTILSAQKETTSTNKENKSVVSTITTTKRLEQPQIKSYFHPNNNTSNSKALLQSQSQTRTSGLAQDPF
jgi:hypothetical protein